jgi:hypothetical protein
VESVQKEQKQLSFEFCSICGNYLRAEQGKVIIRYGGPVILCPDCSGKEKPDAGDFEKKYNL